jgi:hypothetical protein
VVSVVMLFAFRPLKRSPHILYSRSLSKSSTIFGAGVSLVIGPPQPGSPKQTQSPTFLTAIDVCLRFPPRSASRSASDRRALLRVQEHFGKLIVDTRGGVRIDTAIFDMAEGD